MSIGPLGSVRRRVLGAADTPIIVGLVVIIAFAIGMSAWVFMGGGGDDGGGGPDTLVHYRCSKCEHEFEVKRGDLPVLGPDDPGPAILDCPECGQTQSSFSMIQCPNEACGRYYVSQTAEAERAMRAGKRVTMESYRDICRYCKTDWSQWYRENAGKRKR